MQWASTARKLDPAVFGTWIRRPCRSSVALSPSGTGGPFACSGINCRKFKGIDELRKSDNACLQGGKNTPRHGSRRCMMAFRPLECEYGFMKISGDGCCPVFLGSHIMRPSACRGATRVTGNRQFPDRTSAQSRKRRMLNPAFSFVEHDVMVPFDGLHDQIYHLASPASPPLYRSTRSGRPRSTFLGDAQRLGYSPAGAAPDAARLDPLEKPMATSEIHSAAPKPI